MPGPNELNREARVGTDRILLAVAVCFVSVVWQRNALPKLLIVAACYGLMGGAFYRASGGRGTGVALSSGRVAGEAEQSRDLIRVDEKPIARQKA